MSDDVITMRGVSKRFLGRPALHAVDWSVQAGSIHGLMGANGAGKTTLLRLALGLLRPDAGEVVVLGTDLKQDAPDVRQRIHYVAHGAVAVPGFRLGEWLRYASLLYDTWDAALAHRLLDALDLDPHQLLSHLSTGMQTRVQLAVALSARPALLLLDEPTNGLDVVVKRQLLHLIMDMAAHEGTTLVIATHHIEEVERLADTVSVLSQGHVIFHDTMDGIKASRHRLQVVLAEPWPAPLAHDARIVQVARQGRVAQVTIQGPREPMVAAFEAAGAEIVEPLDMDLTDIFQSLLEQEGYRRESLQWPAL